MATYVDVEYGMPSQEYRGHIDRVAEAAFRVRESRIADAIALAAASYSHSRHFDLLPALKDGVSRGKA